MKVSRSESLGSRSGRPASVVLLDERRLELHLQPRLLGGELLDLVCAHVGLKEEKEYFGLALLDEKGLTTWLSLDRKVLEQDLPRKPSVLTLHFLVKFFIESISHLSHVKTVELFYLQARSLVFRGDLIAETEVLYQLAALSLQASVGDYTDEPTTKSLLRKTPLLPAALLLQEEEEATEEGVREHYKKTVGQTRGQALVNYMSIVESMPTYGVHYFEVFDKRQKPWWLGLSCRGIAQYAFEDRKVPVRVFQWKRLENLYFRDKKFSIEVHDLKRVIQAPSSTDLYEDSLRLEEASLGDPELLDAIQDASTRVSSSRRSFHPGSIRVYVWFGKTQGLTKCIWQSAISQHQFYLDRKRAKLRHPVPPRSLNEIARELTRSSISLSSCSSSLSRESSTQSLLGAVGGGRRSKSDEEVSEETRLARMEMLTALRARREALDSKVREKTKLLKELCLKEGELTGDLPPEMPLGPGESLPIIRRRIGTEFQLNFERLLNKSSVGPQAELLSNLEMEREIQSQITSAALKISNDTSVSKSVRKQRKISYQQSQRKLKEIESKLCELRAKISSSGDL
ncbi:Uncharacterized protein FKW44_000607 [Caligus rogercresseyi]|uniref:FERM domain-containing protein n=1 Tax=Caligus rogercresseyi TaxID=217165 RepID=A0A7T8QUZ2_CALRO|nr:Uncharacterized protein FKW44_000607 [Caligus rogercresseyi]